VAPALPRLRLPARRRTPSWGTPRDPSSTSPTWARATTAPAQTSTAWWQKMTS